MVVEVVVAEDDVVDALVEDPADQVVVERRMVLPEAVEALGQPRVEEDPLLAGLDEDGGVAEGGQAHRLPASYTQRKPTSMCRSVIRSLPR